MAIDFQPLDQPKSKIDFQPIESQDQEEPFYQQAAGAVNSMKDSFANSRLGQGISKVSEAVAPAMKMTRRLTDIVTPGSGIPEMAQELAPKISQAEGQAVSDYGQRKGYPMTGAAAGTAVAMIPDFLSAYAGMRGLGQSTNPTIKGLMNTPKELGPQYAAQNAAIGISERVPETASKVQYDNPYQYASQLSKPKYPSVRPSPSLEVVEPGSKKGDPHALFAYNDDFGPNGTKRSLYNVFGDPSHPAIQARGWGSSVDADALKNAGIPITGRQPTSLQYTPIQNQPAPMANPGGAAFTRPKPQIPAEPLPSAVPTKYPNDAGALINQANSRVSQFGGKLTPQELSDYKSLIQRKMANGDIPRFGPDGKPTQIWAQASQTTHNITNALNQAAEPLLQKANLPAGTMPTRAGLNQAYSTASKQQQLKELLSKYLKLGLKGGAGILGAKGAYDHFTQ